MFVKYAIKSKIPELLALLPQPTITDESVNAEKQ